MKTNLRNPSYYIFLVLITVLSASCDDDWLDVKRNKAMIVPTTLKDFRLLLTDELVLTSDYISLMQMSCDEYTVSPTTYSTLTPIEKNAYIWEEELYEESPLLTDWDNSYNQILTANVIIEGLDKLEVSTIDQLEWNSIKGGALYVRAKAFYNLAQTFAKPYSSETSSRDLGIPLRLNSDINLPTTRTSVQETYDQIIADLQESVSLLPNSSTSKTDASKAGAYGLLARCYLSMRSYNLAKISADSSLHYASDLIDYNTLNTSSTFPFTRFNAETVQFAHIYPLYRVYIFLYPNLVPLDLYNSYNENDLRKKLFFYKLGEEMYSFKGTYEGTFTPFSGISTDEMYLIRAECAARSGDVSNALEDLNSLLVNRFKSGTYSPITASTSKEALDVILQERRKELIGRGLRWSDLRRLNQEPDFAITLQRSMNGTTYSLPPNSSRYVFAIPEYVIRVTGIEQNTR